MHSHYNVDLEIHLKPILISIEIKNDWNMLHIKVIKQYINANYLLKTLFIVITMLFIITKSLLHS